MFSSSSFSCSGDICSKIEKCGELFGADDFDWEDIRGIDDVDDLPKLTDDSFLIDPVNA